MFSIKDYLITGLLLSLILGPLFSTIKAQSKPGIFKEYNVDEFTGRIWITARSLPNEIETKEYKGLDSVKVAFNFKRESIENDVEELVSYSELWIVMHGVVKEYDYDYEWGEECYEGLSNIYFLADGERIIREICVTWPNENSTTYYLPFSTTDLLKIGTAKEVKFRIYGNVISITDTGVYILNEFTSDVRRYF